MRCLFALVLGLSPLVAHAETEAPPQPEAQDGIVEPEDVMEMRIAADFLAQLALDAMGASGGRKNSTDRYEAAQALSEAADTIGEAALSLEDDLALMADARDRGLASMRETTQNVDMAAEQALETIFSVRPMGDEFRASLVAAVSQLDELRTMVARINQEKVDVRTICITTPGVTGDLFTRDVSDAVTDYVHMQVSRGESLTAIFDTNAGRTRVTAELTGEDVDTDVALIVMELNEALSSSMNFSNLTGAMQIVTSKDDSYCPIEVLG